MKVDQLSFSVHVLQFVFSLSILMAREGPFLARVLLLLFLTSNSLTSRTRTEEPLLLVVLTGEPYLWERSHVVLRPLSSSGSVVFWSVHVVEVCVAGRGWLIGRASRVDYGVQAGLR